MNPGRRPFPVVGLMQIAMLIVYVLMMAHADWAFSRGSFWGFGAPPDTTRAAFGAPRGEPQDFAAYVVTPWLHQTLLGVILLTLWWGALGRTLREILGGAWVWQLFVLGGAAAVWVHGLAHPEAATTTGVGPIDAILAGVGAELGWGFTHRGPGARKLLLSAVLSLVLIFGLMWVFAQGPLLGENMRAMLGLEGMGAALGAGALLVLLRRVVSIPKALDLGLAVVLLLVVLGGAGARAVEVIRSGDRGRAADFLELLEQVEYEAWHLSNEPRRATPERRAHLDTRLDQVLAHDYVPDLDGRGDLEAYVKTLRAWTKPVELPWIPEAAARKAFDHWYEAHEAPLRKSLGLSPRSSPRFYWRPR